MLFICPHTEHILFIMSKIVFVCGVKMLPKKRKKKEMRLADGARSPTLLILHGSKW